FDAFQAGAALAFIESLSEEAMRYYRCSDFSIYLAKRLLYSLYIIYNCAILTNGPGILTTELLKSLSFDDTFAQYAGLAVTGGIALFQNMTPLGLARTAVSFAGGFAGSLFTMWAGNMIKSSIENSCRQQKINTPSQP